MKNTLLKILSACALLLFSALAYSQSAAEILEGSWSGKLSVAGADLTIVFNFTLGEEGKLAATLDSPDQGAEGIEAEVLGTSPMLRIEVPSLSASYSGVLYRGQIVGTFSQNGLSLPLTLSRGVPELRRPQTPEPPFPYATEDVSFTDEAAGAVLAGTLCWPEGYDPSSGGEVPAAVVMVSGSGLQNRDEEIFGHKPFLVIADCLARAGIASLRYDDRGVGGSVGGDTENATTEDFMQDALAAVEFLRSSGRFASIGVIGHSEGATIAFMLGARGAVDFVVSMAAPGVRGDKALTAQVNRIMELSGQPGMVSEEMYRQNVKLEGNPWLRWFIDYDPSDDISGTSCPVMAVCGSKDCQVISSLNLGAIRARLPENGQNFIKEYDSLNHLFQHCTTGATSEYRSIEETISPEFLSDLVGWISRNFLK